MHTLEIEGYLVHHNGDFSGPVEIVAPGDEASFSVPMSVLRAIVAEQIRSERISELEDASPDAILGSQKREGG